MKGHWFISSDRSLFIVPDDRFGLAETYGPDGDLLDKINAFYRDLTAPMHLIDENVAAQQLGLEWVPHWQRRGTTYSGFYVA